MNLENHEKWWENNLGNKQYIHRGKTRVAPSLEGFQTWMGDLNAPDRVEVRKLFGEFETILDAGCGACPEYYGLTNMYKDIKYTGLDITPKLVEFNKSNNINCVLGNLNDIPFDDESFDIVHSRHVVEHMSGIEKALEELIRVAEKKVFIPFFINPLTNMSNKHKIYLDNKDTTGEVYYNHYSKDLIDNFLNTIPKVKNIEWIKMPSSHSCCCLIITF